MRKKRAIRDLGDLAAEVMRRADTGEKRRGAAAVTVWREVAGETIARHTRGFAVRDNRELVVFVDSAAWANQLSLMSDELVNRINAHLGEVAVRSLRFTVSRKVKQEATWEATEAAVEEFYEEDDRRPVPLDEGERSQAEHLARAIRDRELRDLALRVMIKDLELKKGARKQGSS